MAILVTPSTKVLVQGITGSFGARHTQLSLAYGTQIVAGVTPGKGGQLFEKQVPIFDTVAEAVKATGATCLGDLRPAGRLRLTPFSKVWMQELDLVVCITEGNSGQRHGQNQARDPRKKDAAYRSELSRPGHARRGQGFARRVPDRHRPGLHSQERPHRRCLAQRDFDV
jgi:hypothetical protein